MRKVLAWIVLLAVLLAPGTALSWPPDEDAALDYTSQRSGHVTWMVIGPHGKHFGYRAWTKVPAASTLKVMFLVAYLRQKSVRNRDLKQWEKDLLAPMITRSDNLAATRIDDILGARPMYRLARDVGMKHFHFVKHPWGLSTVTAADMAPLMYHLERFIPDRHEPFAKYLLAHVVARQRWGIGRLSFPNWKLYFKGGWGSGSGAVEHQVVLLEQGDLRVAAAVMITSSPSHDYAKQTLKGVFHRLLQPMPTS